VTVKTIILNKSCSLKRSIHQRYQASTVFSIDSNTTCFLSSKSAY